MAEWLSNNFINMHLTTVSGVGSRPTHARQAKFCLCVCQVVFLEVLLFSHHLLIGPSHMID